MGSWQLWAAGAAVFAALTAVLAKLGLEGIDANLATLLRTLVVAAASHHLAGHLYAKLPYDPLKDFTGVALLGYTGYVIAAPANLGANTLAEFVRIVKAKPGAYNYASAGNGSATHLGMACHALANACRSSPMAGS